MFPKEKKKLVSLLRSITGVEEGSNPHGGFPG